MQSAIKHRPMLSADYALVCRNDAFFFIKLNGKMIENCFWFARLLLFYFQLKKLIRCYLIYYTELKKPIYDLI